MNELILLSIGLVALVGALCTLIYTRISNIEGNANKGQDQLNRLEVQLHELVHTQMAIQSRLEKLAEDVLHREIYPNTDDRHKLAINAAKDGQSMSHLIQVHGLSSDEAALIMALHGGTQSHSNEHSQFANSI